MLDESCGTCRFFDEQTTNETEVEGIGICRRYPPLAVQRSQKRAQENQLQNGWPTVVKHDWCGEYRAIPGASGIHVA